MQTPVADFVKEYAGKKGARFHMPGHKGKAFLGCEPFDITEIAGADALYEADGIIAESERNAARLFGTGGTFFSTEGSSQCVRAMLFLAVRGWRGAGRPYVVAARNAHKAFLYAAALLDFDVVWLFPEETHSLCCCRISPEKLEDVLKGQEQPPAAVYVTSPDYLGGRLAVGELAEVCHRNGTVLAVDNAHGAYLHFLEQPQHPMDLGADLCCDSAHKTLPVLTGGAYLHIAKRAPEAFCADAKQALVLFGSTSPSYLTLASIDLCNAYLADGYAGKLAETVRQLERVRRTLHENGWETEETDPLKLTLLLPEEENGVNLARRLGPAGVECEYADAEYIVFMATPENDGADYERLVQALGVNRAPYLQRKKMRPVQCARRCTIREAFFAPHERVSVERAAGRICGAPLVSCPPAIPVVVPGEVIDRNAAAILKYYNNDTVEVLK